MRFRICSRVRGYNLLLLVLGQDLLLFLVSFLLLRVLVQRRGMRRRTGWRDAILY